MARLTAPTMTSRLKSSEPTTVPAPTAEPYDTDGVKPCLNCSIQPW
jgi:hypothetical protein